MPKHYRPPGKKKEGNAAKYITRNQAVKQIGVSLHGFRRLCILKGLHPREPKKKFKGTHQTYYHTKDILFLRREPLVEKFREQKIHDRKIKKALSKKNKSLAQLLMNRKPGYTLDRLILERYPRFIDALGDLDDCLSLVHLFAALPALESEKIAVDRVHNCRRLSHEWQAYISRTHKLRKTFVSVKGIYYQAVVEGQKITWITPHTLQQVIVDDVDFSIMLIFLEFYEALLGFVNFKLYHSIDVEYPPILDPRLEALAAELYALSRWLSAKSGSRTLESNPSEPNQNNPDMVDGQPDESDLRSAQLQHQLPSHEPGALMNLLGNVNGEDNDDDEETKECKNLFRKLKFFLSREVPKESLLFVISAFGGSVSWEGEGGPFKETDESITHQIIDRSTQGRKLLSREYVQPQWVYDSVNARIILPSEDYLVGRIPPPHLSPFVDNESEGYVPDYAERIKQLQAAARKEILPLPGMGKEDLDDPQNLLVEGVISRREANEAAERKQKMQALEKQYHEELKMELQGGEFAETVISKQTSAEDAETTGKPAPDPEETPEEILAKTTMSRKKRGLYEAIQMSKKRKQDSVNLLKSRKKRLEGQKS